MGVRPLLRRLIESDIDLESFIRLHRAPAGRRGFYRNNSVKRVFINGNS